VKSLPENVIKANIVEINDSATLKDVNIEANQVFIGDGSILHDCIIRSKGDVIIGNGVQLKERSVLNSFKGIKIGDYTIIDRGVIIGGIQSQKSRFEIGCHCVLLHHSYVNTTREVKIGNNVGVGGYCMIFTHGVWQNAFRGYPFQFGSVEIKDDVWLPWHVLVMPGVTIGRGATIGGGSVVTESIPDYCLAVGTPAKVIRKDGYPKHLNLPEKDKLAREILEDFRGYSEEILGEKITFREEKDEVLLTSNIGNLLYKTVITDYHRGFDIISFDIPEHLQREGWIDIEREFKSSELSDLGEAFVSFIRRYGVRMRCED